MKSNSRIVASSNSPGWATSRPLNYATIGLVFIASFYLYARTMAPGLLDGDEGEFQTNIYKLGVSHTGYPLFFLLGKLWTMIIPVGTVAFRANLFSVFWGAVAVVALYIFARWLTSSSWVGIICAIFFAASRVEWSQAIIPRVYTMNAFFVILVTFLFFLWRTGKVDLLVPVFVYGLSLTNHRTMIWFAPAIAIFILWRERGAIFAPRRLFTLLAAFVLPLLLYVYVPLRGDSDVGVEFHMEGFSDMILAGNASRWMRYGPWGWVVSRITELYIPLLYEQFTAFGFVAAIGGMGLLALNKPPRGFPSALSARETFVFILLAHLANAIFCIFFWTIDVEKFFIPSYLTFLFFGAVGIKALGDWLLENKDGASNKLRFTTFYLLIATFLAAGAVLIARNYALNDWSKKNDAAETWNENLSQPLEKNALIVGPWESLTPLEYMQYVEQRRTDLQRWKIIKDKYLLTYAPNGSRQADIERAVRDNTPLYLTFHPADSETLDMLATEFRLTRVGELWRVLPLAPMAPAPVGGKPVATFTDTEQRTIELLGVTLPSKTRPGEFMLVTFFWRAPQTPSAHFTMSVRLLDAENRVVVQRDAEPVSGRRATVGWASNEVVQDDAGLVAPPDAAPGKYRVGVIIYNGGTGENMQPNKSDAAQSELYILGEVNIAP